MTSNFLSFANSRLQCMKIMPYAVGGAEQMLCTFFASMITNEHILQKLSRVAQPKHTVYLIKIIL